MKKILFLILICMIVSSCRSTTTHYEQLENTEDLKVLIAYFSWADNAEEYNPDELIVDSYTGASLSVPGNAEVVARFINEQVEADMHKIQVQTPYSEVYDECLARARTELSTDSRPALKTSVENFNSYDVIFLGFPNWWNSVPRAVLTFIDSYNFEDKTVIPFCVHGTNGKTNPVNEVSNYLPETTVIMESIGVYRPETLQSQPDVNEWLERIGFIHEA